MTDKTIERVRKNKSLIIAALVGAAILVFAAVSLFPGRAGPLYAITRTCDFVTIGGVTGAFCTDGSNYLISPLVVSPNP